MTWISSWAQDSGNGERVWPTWRRSLWKWGRSSRICEDSLQTDMMMQRRQVLKHFPEAATNPGVSAASRLGLCTQLHGMQPVCSRAGDLVTGSLSVPWLAAFSTGWMVQLLSFWLSDNSLFSLPRSADSRLHVPNPTFSSSAKLHSFTFFHMFDIYLWQAYYVSSTTVHAGAASEWNEAHHPA